ncbi:MAG: hypothetical protein JST10_14180 [Bacteroidetes bacterium]|nr:hypothetical protein [Bacteroidota bacterium]MBS1633711.1 hypothetical protein [Bacteroidota bacterium]
MQMFRVILKKEKRGTYNLISWIALSVNFITLFLITSATGFQNIFPALLGGIAILMAILLRRMYPGKGTVAFGIALAICCIAWLLQSHWWIALVDLLFLLLSIQAAKDLVLYFSEEEIKYSSILTKRIPWTEVNNALLKDDILTIDLKNNRIIQQLVDDRNSLLNEKEFNDFCKKHLTPEP